MSPLYILLAPIALSLYIISSPPDLFLVLFAFAFNLEGQ